MTGRPCRTGALALAAMVLLTGVAQAKTFEVTRTSDPVPGACTRNDCSLREAVLAANERLGRDTIVLPKAKRYELTRPNPGGVPEDGSVAGDLDVSNNPLAVIHPGNGRATVDANGLDRVFEVFAGAPTRFTKLRILGGVDTTALGGGGVRADANATFVRSALVGNSSTDLGGGIDADSDARLVFKRSLVRGNESDVTGGGIATSATAGLSVQRSQVLGNRAAEFGGGIQMISPGNSVLKQSTVTGNRAGANGGGIHAIPNMDPGVVRIIESTVAGNSAVVQGGGISVEEHRMIVVNSTVAGNSANGNGGGIFAQTGADVSLNAVTVVRNVAAADSPLPPPNEGDCEGFDEPTDLVRGNPKIGRLKRNGGPTKTVDLKRGSAAIGKAHGPSAPNRDQRGRKRDNRPDIGAFERGA